MPDGDVFGVRIDGSWRRAAQLLENDATDEDIEESVVQGLNSWQKQWIPSLDMVEPFAAAMLRVLQNSRGLADLVQLSIELDRIVRDRPYGSRLIAEAAKVLLAKPVTWRDRSQHDLTVTLYIGALRLAVSRGFTAPAVLGSVRSGRFTKDQAHQWRQRLNACVDKVLSNRESKLRENPTSRRIGVNPLRRASKVGTARLLDEPLKLN